jgi:hypothetical protein
MKQRNTGSKAQPFPTVRPPVDIRPSRARSFVADCRELPWWFAVPQVGRRVLWATYDPPDWHLSDVSDIRAVRPAKVHSLETVELIVDGWSAETGWQSELWRMYGRLTDNAVQWLATMRLRDGVREVRTFLDEGFDRDWQELPRPLEDRGRFVRRPDGTYRQRRSARHRARGAIGAGMFRVRVGERAFTCLRVLDAGQEPSEEGILVEAFLNRRGRTVLFRRHNGRLWAVGRQHDQPWDEKLPDQARIVIDGRVFVHWYDCLTDVALGPAPA